MKTNLIIFLSFIARHDKLYHWNLVKSVTAFSVKVPFKWKTPRGRSRTPTTCKMECFLTLFNDFRPWIIYQIVESYLTVRQEGLVRQHAIYCWTKIIPLYSSFSILNYFTAILIDSSSIILLQFWWIQLNVQADQVFLYQDG